LCNTSTGEEKQNSAPTTEGEMENHEEGNNINKLKDKIESAYYQVTQTEITRRRRLQKLKNMFKIEEMMKTATEAIAKILEDKDFNLTKINHPIYTTAAVIT
jgi:hypothetical protein